MTLLPLQSATCQSDRGRKNPQRAAHQVTDKSDAALIAYDILGLPLPI